MITTFKTTLGTIVTICKYEEYQGMSSVGTTVGTSSSRQLNATINKNERMEKEKKINAIPDLGESKILFMEFWDAYDKKIGKPKAEERWNRLSQEEQEACIEYIPKYKKAQPEKQYRKNPEAFLNNKGWEDELIHKGHSKSHKTSFDGQNDSNQYKIPKEDIFGFSGDELQNRINEGKYEKLCT